MKRNERNNAYLEAINTTGVRFQNDIAIEEMSELTKALIKNNRGKNNVDEISEEIADVMIMLETLMLVYKISPKVVNKLIDEKIKYMLSIMEKKKNNQILSVFSSHEQNHQK